MCVNTSFCRLYQLSQTINSMLVVKKYNILKVTGAVQLGFGVVSCLYSLTNNCSKDEKFADVFAIVLYLLYLMLFLHEERLRAQGHFDKKPRGD